MNIAHELLKAVSVVKMADMVTDVRQLLPHFYEYSEADFPGEEFKKYLYLASGGSASIHTPFRMRLGEMKAALLLVTDSGAGRLIRGRHQEPLSEGSCILCDLIRPVTLEAAILPWNSRVFYIFGEGLSLYKPMFEKASYIKLVKRDQPALAYEIDRLTELSFDVDQSDIFAMHEETTLILSIFASYVFPKNPPEYGNIPSYLKEMSDMIRNRSAEKFSLSECESLLGISRFRLCREYTAAFGLSPLRHINQLRLEKAQKMLLTTNLQVQEISSMIGFDDENGFIRLFKKQTGTTPAKFRASARQVRS